MNSAYATSDMSHHNTYPPPSQHLPPPSSAPHPPSRQLPPVGPPTMHHNQYHQSQHPNQHQHPHQHQQQHAHLSHPPTLPPPSAAQHIQHHHQNQHQHQHHKQHHQHHHQHQPPPQLPPQAHPPQSQLQHHQSQHQHAHLQPPTLSSNQPLRSDDMAINGGNLRSGQSQQTHQMVTMSQQGEACGRKYQLSVLQQPKRARMCGYGDKDRRPITPPPCVRLLITDITTGQEVNYKEIEYNMFVLNVDLWNEQGTQEVNLCRQPPTSGTSQQAPTASTGTSYGYASEPVASVTYTPVIPSNRDYSQPPMSYAQDYQPYSQASASYPPNGSYAPPQQQQQYYQQQGGYRPEHAVVPPPSQRFDTMAYADNNSNNNNNTPSVSFVHDQYKGAMNRNLIGSVSASAFCLTDTAEQEGIWFVLQDLSVRLEGTYRLKFSFVNIAAPGPSQDPTDSLAAPTPSSRVTKGRASVLASCFSDTFVVFSAKKFPGVCESTALSKTFATQGIKIPIRKDGNKGGDDDDE